MRRAGVSLLALGTLAVLSSVWGSSALAQSTCSLEKPPTDAAVNENHGSFFFVYPRTVDTTSYTGCQIMWDELGRQVLVLHFSDGVLTEYSSTDYSATSQVILCRYKRGHLVHGNSSDCAGFEALKRGILNTSAEKEPPVPRDRDARIEHVP
jgi:hypothetical protein